MTDPKLAPFTLHTTPYKTIQGIPIPAHILIPKSISSASQTGKYPILIRFHGGFLVTGTALYTEWLPNWAINLVTQNSAILIMPDYRLLPEATGQEILEDLKDFWKWFGVGFPGYLAGISGNGKIGVNWEKVAVYGESAGGYLAIRSSLLDFSTDVVRDVDGMEFRGPKAVIAAYPMTMLRGKWYSEAGETKSPFGVPQFDGGILDTHIEGMGQGLERKMVISVDPPARLEIAVTMVQRGRWTEIFERAGDEGLWLEDVIVGRSGVNEGGEREGKGAYLFTFHGMKDTAVPWEDTREWMEIWGRKFGENRVKGVWREGMEHGFDGEVEEESVEGKWLKEGLEEVKKEWLGN
ncbi:hypothetical protein SBOR_7736 [Sclerotinia borealis F-4128]|uniref:Alpha/beta hydrolase fold-3 domain-containing protein n=1 Tax=Sclerotinia borealis (strain F-4128) TaxID=1432307 RepID=W9C7Q1_SCLBF|nr:hypothetical protein SBOR_7736 [Sclerotinia borealis F-4128]